MFPSQPLSRIEFSFVEPDFMATTTLSYTTIPQFCLGITGAYRAVERSFHWAIPSFHNERFFSHGSARDKLVISSFPKKSTGGEFFTTEKKPDPTSYFQ